MKIEITKELKVRLLEAIKEGVFDTDKFQELATSTIKWDEVKNYAVDPIAESPLNELSSETLRKIKELIRIDKEGRATQGYTKE